MEEYVAYAKTLNYAIPFFMTLISIEFFVGLYQGKKTVRSMDTISSLSSGISVKRCFKTNCYDCWIFFYGQIFSHF